MNTEEQDIRIQILDTLLTTPHRKLEETWPAHRQLAERDPRFYPRLAAWYAANGDVRDHKEMFVVTLVQSEFEGHRDVGLALLRDLPPYEVARVVDFIHGRKTRHRVRVAVGEARREQSVGLLRRILGLGADDAVAEPAATRVETRLEDWGLGRNVPRSVRTEVARYLREREADPEWFDSTALVARKALKRLYAVLHLKPGPRAQKVLFEEDPPEDSRLMALRRLAKAESPAEQARAIVQHGIPYRVAATVVKQMTPTVLLALIEQMSPQELINSIGSLRRRGALDNPDLKARIDLKLEAARTASRVSAFKAEEAVRAAGVQGDVRRKLEEVADSQVKSRGRIVRPTALLVDKSASMEQTIDLGKRIAAMISTVCDAELWVCAFDNLPHEIVPRGRDLAGWEAAFEGIRAAGCTSCGVAVNLLRRQRRRVEQILLVTDEEENIAPFFVAELQAYREAMKVDPGVCIVRTPNGGNLLEQQCLQARIPVDVFRFSGDYYSLPSLVPFLARPSKLDLLLEILATPLPMRRPA